MPALSPAARPSADCAEREAIQLGVFSFDNLSCSTHTYLWDFGDAQYFPVSVVITTAKQSLTLTRAIPSFCCDVPPPFSIHRSGVALVFRYRDKW